MRTTSASGTAAGHMCVSIHHLGRKCFYEAGLRKAGTSFQCTIKIRRRAKQPSHGVHQQAWRTRLLEHRVASRFQGFEPVLRKTPLTIRILTDFVASFARTRRHSSTPSISAISISLTIGVRKVLQRQLQRQPSVVGLQHVHA
jgi:hypothetical protein